MVKVITDFLLDDTEKIEYLLEQMDMLLPHHEQGFIRCGMPNSQFNNRSIRITLNEYLSVQMYSDEGNDYCLYEIQNLFTLVQFVKGYNFPTSLRWICSVIGLEYNGEMVAYKSSKAISVIKKFKKKEIHEVEHKILDNSYLNQYPKCIVQEWVDEGINAETQEIFGVCIDHKYSRWKFPIHDELWNLITLKGRTFVENFKYKNIPKYSYYPAVGNNNNILFGLNLTLPFIEEMNELLLFEGEKSVMKLWSNDIKNSTSMGSSLINPNFIRKIISLKCRDVVICLDKGVSLEVIKAQAMKLKLFKNVYYIYDFNDLLKHKDSPIDQGVEVFKQLYANKIRV